MEYIFTKNGTTIYRCYTKAERDIYKGMLDGLKVKYELEEKELCA